VLSENETITSYANWQSNMLYCISVYVMTLLDFLKQTGENNLQLTVVLTNDGEDVAEANCKTAVQKKIVWKEC